MFRKTTLIMMLTLIISACTSGDSVTDVPFATATPRIANTVPAPDTIGEVSIPADFAGGEPIILGEGGTFAFEVSGEFVAEVDLGTIVYTYLPNTGAVPARNQLYIASNDATISQQITFEFSPNIQAGQFNLVAPEDYAPGAVSVSYARLVFDGTDTRVEAFTQNIEGTLSVIDVGEIISGEFVFSADFTETSPEGEIDSQSVEITGRFEGVPYQISLDDPFEIEVPLPTRNFTTDATEQP